MGKYNTVADYPMESPRKLCARFDIDKVKKTNDVSLGDEVTVTIKGKVRSLRGPDEFLSEGPKGKEKEYQYPGSIEVEISEMKIGSVGMFDLLDGEDD